MDVAIREWESDRASEGQHRVLSQVGRGKFAPMFSAHSDLILLVHAGSIARRACGGVEKKLDKAGVVRDAMLRQRRATSDT
jgi:hypothetical protein